MNVIPDEIPVVDKDLTPRHLLVRRQEGSAGYAESAFDDLIVSQAESIASTLRAAGLVEPSLTLRVVGTQIAMVDVVMAEVDADGLIYRLVLFETKLFKNPESNRKVVAQIFDYASRDWSVDELLKGCNEDAKKWLEEQRDVLEGVVQNGDFLLVIAGDRIQPRLQTIAKPLLDRYAFKGVELALLSLAVFEGGGLTVVVPNLVGAIAGAKRDLRIQVKVRLPDGNEVPAKLELEAVDEETAESRLWNEAGFVDYLRSGGEEWPDWEEGFKLLLKFVSETPGLVIRWSKAVTPCFNVEATCADGGVKLLWASGRSLEFSIWRDALIKRIGEARTDKAIQELASRLDLPIKKTPSPYVGNSTSYLDLRKPLHRDVLFAWLKRMGQEVEAS